MRRKPCKSCPLSLSVLYGFDPKTLAQFSNRNWCEQSLRESLHCTEAHQPCQGHLAALEMAIKCHQQGKPIPFKLHARFQEQLQAIVQQFSAGQAIASLAASSEFDLDQIEQAIRAEMNRK